MPDKDPFESAFQLGTIDKANQRKAVDDETAGVMAIIDSAFSNLERLVRSAVGDSTAFGTLSASESNSAEATRHRYELQMAGSGQRMHLRITGSAAVVNLGPGVAPAVACDALNVEVSTVSDSTVAHVGRGFDEGIPAWFSVKDGGMAMDVEAMRELIRATTERASRNAS
jgi:hypothetical protein